MGQTRASGYATGYASGGIRCQGGVNVPYRPVTPTRNLSKSGKRNNPQSKSVWKGKFVCLFIIFRHTQQFLVI
jgi:hypothetical protein